MNLSSHIEHLEPVTLEKLIRLTEEAEFRRRSIYDDVFVVTDYNEGEGVTIECHDLQHVNDIGLYIEFYHERWYSYLFEGVNTDDFLLTMARALPDKFTIQDIVNYLTALESGEAV